MGRIPLIDLDAAPPETQAAVRRHLAAGHAMTAEKRTLLHSLPAFLAVEEASYALDAELQSLIGKLDADLFEYAVSAENECPVCTLYFARLLRDRHGIDPADFAPTPRQALLMDYGRALARDPKGIGDAQFEALRAEMAREFGEGEGLWRALSALTAMGAMMVANNTVNDALRIGAQEGA